MRTKHDPDSAGSDVASRDGLAAARILALSEGLADTLRTAEALVTANRRVDLHGLDQQVRDLCGRVVTLPPDQAAPLLPRLHGLMARIDSLLAALAAAAAAS